MGEIGLNKIAELLNIPYAKIGYLDEIADKIKINDIADKEMFVQCFLQMLNDGKNVEILKKLLFIEDISALFINLYVNFLELIDKLDVYDLRRFFLVNLVNYFYNIKMVSPMFWDYEDFIEYMFKVAKGYSYAFLSELKIENKYIEIVSLGMKFAGEQNEIGYAYSGGKKVRENAKFLSKEIIEHILKANEYVDSYRINQSFRRRYIFELIDYSEISDSDKYTLKFRYIDVCVIGNRLLGFIRSYIQVNYSEYHYIDDEVDNKDVKVILESSKKRKLFVKVQLTGRTNCFFITEEMDSDKGILQFLVRYENNKVIIRRYQGEAEEQCIEYEFEYSDYSEMNGKIEEILKNSEAEKFELIYVYVQDLYDLPQRELFFSNEYDVRRKNSIFNLNKTSQNRKIPQDFFGKNISNVYALVGKNGSGKSAIIKLLMDSEIFNPNGDNKTGEYLIIYKIGRNLYWTSSSKIFEVRSQYTIYKLENNKKFYSIVNTKVALFSNVFDLQKRHDMNILMEKDCRINLTTQKVINEIGGAANYDIYRILNYIMKYQMNNKETYDKWENKCVKSIVIKKVMELSEDLIDRIEHVYKSRGGAFSVEFCSDRQIEALQKCMLIKDGIDNKEALEEVSIINKVYDLIENDTVVLKEKNIPLIVRFVDIIYKNVLLKKSVAINFSNLSSGECGKLTLFARILCLFHVTKDMPQTIKYENIGGNGIMIFDEAEVYLHPAWQRKILQQIVNYLEEINKEYKIFDNLIILLSSNSPFYLSDLPQENIIFLGQEGEIGDERTFGQNIHMLMRNSFFMKDGLMGEFSLRKISQSIDALKKGTWEHRLDEIQFICDIIGEPIIRNSLQEMLDNVTGSDKQEKIRKKKDEIRKLQAEIEALGGD